MESAPGRLKFDVLDRAVRDLKHKLHKCELGACLNSACQSSNQDLEERVILIDQKNLRLQSEGIELRAERGNLKEFLR